MRRSLALCLILAVLAPGSGEAALFCLNVRGIAPQCDYADAAQCRKRASDLGAVCSVNSAEITLPQGFGAFCIVDSSRYAECLYADRAACDGEALRKNAVCVDRPHPGQQPDPYRFDPNRRF